MTKATGRKPTGRPPKPFWAHVHFGPGCWTWLASKKHDGYGKRKHNGKMTTAHRVSFEMEFGPIPDGLAVLHRCDNPPCVRPDHLFLGTQQENIADMVAKGRHSRGAKHSLVVKGRKWRRKI